jgi:hypothetical protein
MATIAKLPNHLTNIEVTLYGSHTKATSSMEARLPLTVANVSIEEHYIEKYVYGNPKDWVQRRWSHGIITLSGCIFKADINSSYIVNQLLAGKYVYKLRLGNVATLYGCRKLGVAVTSTSSSGTPQIVGALNYQFDSYTDP